MGEIVIELAKATLLMTLGLDSSFDLQQALKNYPDLQKNAAVFVTLTKGEQRQLRGCIGSLQAYQPLYKDIMANTKSAALRDPRFKPLTKEELLDIKIEISILSEPKSVKYTDSADLKKQIRVNIDGVVLKYQGHRATYLPQVWEQLPQFENFFHSLCQKANLPSACIENHPDIQTYQVAKYKEE